MLSYNYADFSSFSEKLNEQIKDMPSGSGKNKNREEFQKLVLKKLQLSLDNTKWSTDFIFDAYETFLRELDKSEHSRDNEWDKIKEIAKELFINVFIGKDIYIQHEISKRRYIFDVEITNQYAELSLPKVPIFHPYNPTGEDVQRINSGLPKFSICTRLKNAWDNIPTDIKNILASKGITKDNLDIFFVTQDMPWHNNNLLFRAHYWANPNAPYKATNYNETKKISVVLLKPSDPTTKIGSAEPNIFLDIDVSSHSINEQDQIVRSSPDTPAISRADWFNSLQIITLTIEGKHAALTVHWLLNDRDQSYIETILNKMKIHSKLELDKFVDEAKKLDYKGSLDQLIRGSIIANLLIDVVSSGKVEEVRRLLETGIDVNAENHYGTTALQVVAANTGNLDIAKMLVEKGASLTHTDGSGRNALGYAEASSRLNIITYLREVTNRNRGFIEAALKLNVNAVNEQGATALQLAAQQSELEVIKRLLEAGASLTQTDRFGRNALQYAKARGNSKITIYLRKMIPAVLLIEAVSNNHIEEVRRLLESGIDVNAENHYGTTALQVVAANTGNLDIAKMLVEKGASLTHTDGSGRNALGYAEASNRIVIKDYLKTTLKTTNERPRPF